MDEQDTGLVIGLATSAAREESQRTRAALEARVAELEAAALASGDGLAFGGEFPHNCLPAKPSDSCSYVLILRWDSETSKHVLEWQMLTEFECPA